MCYEKIACLDFEQICKITHHIQIERLSIRETVNWSITFFQNRQGFLAELNFLYFLLNSFENIIFVLFFPLYDGILGYLQEHPTNDT